MLSKHTIIVVVGLVSFVGSARSQETSGRPAQNVDTGSGATNDTNGANNPVNPMLTIDLQNYFVPSPEGYSGRIGDQGLLRVSVPIDEFGVHQFVRVILPINTTATEQGGPNTGVGDLTVYDLVLFQAHGTTIGAGRSSRRQRPEDLPTVLGNGRLALPELYLSPLTGDYWAC